jgi:hypothetical protein
MEMTVNYATDEKKPLEKKASSPLLRKILSGVVLAIIVGGSAAAFYYVTTHRPDMIAQVRLKLDRFGLAAESPMEVKRVADINKLPISYEEKQILINRTIFMGASPRMVMLALGQPKQGHKTRDALSGKESIILVYHLPKELRPTMLSFENNKLSEAKKGSSIDYQNSAAFIPE